MTEFKIGCVLAEAVLISDCPEFPFLNGVFLINYFLHPLFTHQSTFFFLSMPSFVMVTLVIIFEHVRNFLFLNILQTEKDNLGQPVSW